MRKGFVATVSVILMATSLLTAATISAPAATVKLTKTVPISMAELESEVRQYQESAKASGGDPTTVDPLQVLNLLINNELFRQGAARDGVKITDAMIDSAYASQKASIEASYGQRLTDEQFAQVIVNNFGSVADYRTMIGEQLLVDSYVRLMKASDLNKAITIPESEITSFYRKYRTQFVSPETVKLSHIYIPFTDNETTNRANKAKLDDVARRISSGALSFEKAVVEYSEDAQSKSKAGDIGWLTMDNTDALAGLGDAFFDAAFSTEVGMTSAVVTSLTGYHILKVLTYSEPKILALDDVISPETTVTIRAYITDQLSQAKQEEVYIKAINDLVSDLRKSATVNILYK
ncbi:MAG TPA: peptidylprolyl isomerase [Sphaerochaeta sp.]|jgi:peptidyl-prolyl cis-trans isomerase SurA|nr:peptidylprolyl isomerase [Spirochaetota bacterium]NLV61497.1 peptidylprolyl isomerase [Spirochaetales bacterium]HOE83847.1 peptidylprolyl isomerase [Sphaerochaeta sp.]HOQ94314.1 peptidylprolyl isomerase [Sphaerochaeta sp.]HPK46750.1 peptidylprolyl isomerase [Sphaerochaeta sp.]